MAVVILVYAIVDFTIAFKFGISAAITYSCLCFFYKRVRSIWNIKFGKCNILAIPDKWIMIPCLVRVNEKEGYFQLRR